MSSPAYNRPGNILPHEGSVAYFFLQKLRPDLSYNQSAIFVIIHVDPSLRMDHLSKPFFPFLEEYTKANTTGQ